MSRRAVQRQFVPGTLVADLEGKGAYAVGLVIGWIRTPPVHKRGAMVASQGWAAMVLCQNRMMQVSWLNVLELEKVGSDVD